MNFSSRYIEDAVNEFSKLPGVGKRTALRLVLHLLKESPAQVNQLAEALQNVKSKTKICKTCHHISDDEVCNICSNSARNQSVICVVESIREVMAIENTSHFQGVFHVLGGVISPINGIGPDQINIESLLQRIRENEVKELIMALNPTIDGDTTIFYLSKQIKEENLDVSISTIARGVAFGGELEYVDEFTLARSIETRQPFDHYLSSK